MIERVACEKKLFNMSTYPPRTQNRSLSANPKAGNLGRDRNLGNP
jgi:hypothetical protein